MSNECITWQYVSKPGITTNSGGGGVGSGKSPLMFAFLDNNDNYWDVFLAEDQNGNINTNDEAGDEVRTLMLNFGFGFNDGATLTYAKLEYDLNYRNIDTLRIGFNYPYIPTFETYTITPTWGSTTLASGGTTVGSHVLEWTGTQPINRFCITYHAKFAVAGDWLALSQTSRNDNFTMTKLTLQGTGNPSTLLQGERSKGVAFDDFSDLDEIESLQNYAYFARLT